LASAPIDCGLARRGESTIPGSREPGLSRTGTTAAGLRGRASQFRLNALSDEALSGVLLNVLSMETIIANTFRGSRTTKKVSAA
jgi:hypothetical protein